MATHEIWAHLVQAAIICDQIEKGLVPQCMGLTTLHGPEQFQSEGLAQTILHFLDTEDTSSTLIQAWKEWAPYKRMVAANIHHMINAGSPIEECVKYGTKHALYPTPNDIAHSLRSKVNVPQFRCYEYVYGPSAAFFMRFARQASAAQKQEFLRAVYNEWLLPDELVVLTRALLQPDQVPAPEPSH